MKGTFVVFATKRFDGTITDSDTKEKSVIENSCKVTCMYESFSEKDLKADENTISEKIGKRIEEMKCEYEIFQTLQAANQFPCEINAEFKIENQRVVLTKLDPKDIKPLSIVPATVKKAS